MDSSGNAEYSRLFIEETRDYLESLEKDLILLEISPESYDDELINRIFRAVHSIKGSSGFLGFVKVKELSHAMENVLGRIRNREMSPSQDLISLLLDSKDLLTKMITTIDESEYFDISRELEALKNIVILSKEGKDGDEKRKALEVKLPSGKKIFTIAPEKARKARNESLFIYMIEYDVQKDMEDKGMTAAELLEGLEKNGMSLIDTLEVRSAEKADPAAPEEDRLFVVGTHLLEPDLLLAVLMILPERLHVIYDPEHEEPRDSGAKEKMEEAAPVLPEKPESERMKQSSLRAESDEMLTSPPMSPPREKEPEIAEDLHLKEHSINKQIAALSKDTIKVKLKSLDTLMSLAGELVLTRNQLLQNIRTWDKRGIETTFQRLNLITSEVQETIMSTRMQPIEVIFSKFNRLVRDLAKDLGKEVELAIEGEDVELDKTVIEAIGDPLTHLMRNAVDHGIEAPEARMRAGKPEKGIIRLSAFHEAGQVKIVISDDGAGIDGETVRQKALHSGHFSAVQINEMTEKELLKLIFLPGFSTADNVTDVSGRGVGMDVVVSNLSRIGGVIDLDTEKNRGTTFEIKLPLTLAIIPSLIVALKDERFAIPQVSIVELVRVPPGKIAEQIQKIGSAVVFRLRGELLPLVSLQDVLGIPHDAGAAESGNGKTNLDRLVTCACSINIVVVTVGDLRYGMAVDSFSESEEIVVKPLGRHLRGCRLYAGATIEGTGRISLILDVLGICRMMNLAEVKEMAEKKFVKQKTVIAKKPSTFLLVKNEGDEQFAIPLPLVSRIERISRKKIEKAAGKPTLRYEESTLSLHSLEELLPTALRADSDFLYIIVLHLAGKDAGFMVSEVLDIIETDKTIDEVTFRQPGIRGSFNIFDRITLVLDFSSMTPQQQPSRRSPSSTQPQGTEERHQPVILVAEDSEFFLNHIDSILKNAGYMTLLARDGLEALELLENNQVDGVLTDIEMPNLDGLGLAQAVRKNPATSALPIIALTSIAGETAAQKGLNAGIDEYIIKLDRDHLLERLRLSLAQRQISQV
ncbi:MAG: chemotaxis protein CheW [Candidatus Eremiobacteraeota bacterium]|nr:chemotaxis protein CheW [Candidatus Eremiobacteraeota bacterium]